MSEGDMFGHIINIIYTIVDMSRVIEWFLFVVDTKGKT